MHVYRSSVLLALVAPRNRSDLARDCIMQAIQEVTGEVADEHWREEPSITQADADRLFDRLANPSTNALHSLYLDRLYKRIVKGVKGRVADEFEEAANRCWGRPVVSGAAASRRKPGEMVKDVMRKAWEVMQIVSEAPVGQRTEERLRRTHACLCGFMNCT
jgi:hypothetical protein